MARQYDARETVGVEQGMAAEAAHRRAKMSWQEICLESMHMEIARLRRELARAERVAASIPAIHAEIERVTANRDRLAAEHK